MPLVSVTWVTVTRRTSRRLRLRLCFVFFQAEDGIRYSSVTGVQTCALPISSVRVERRPLLLRPVTAISLARGMGWCEAARYIVADAAGRDERKRRRPRAHHGCRGDPHYRVGAGGRAADSVRTPPGAGVRAPPPTPAPARGRT